MVAGCWRASLSRPQPRAPWKPATTTAHAQRLRRWSQAIQVSSPHPRTPTGISLRSGTGIPGLDPDMQTEGWPPHEGRNRRDLRVTQVHLRPAPDAWLRSSVSGELCQSLPFTSAPRLDHLRTLHVHPLPVAFRTGQLKLCWYRRRRFRCTLDFRGYPPEGRGQLSFRRPRLWFQGPWMGAGTASLNPSPG